MRLGLAVWGTLGMAGFLFLLGALGPFAGLILCFVAALGLSWHLGPEAVFLTLGALSLLLAWRTRRDLPRMKG